MSEAVAATDAGAATSGLARFATDERLVRRAIGGDGRAFAAIFRRYHQELYRYCLAILANPGDAEDALQNTMVKALRALPGEPRQIELKPWLYRIAHNESIDLVRRRRGSEPLDPESIVAGPGLAQEAEARERLGKLIADLETLPERQRGALVMRELSGLGFEQIGAALGTSAASARQTLYEARLSLRQIEAGREMNCDTVTRAISDADGRVMRRRDIRAHLRSCPDCRRFRAEIDGRSRDLAALSPLPALAAAGILQGIFGGGGAGGGGLAGLLGGGAQALGTSAAVKATATVAVVAAIGAAAGQRADLVDLGLPVGGGTDPAPTVDRAAADRVPVGAGATADPARPAAAAVGAHRGAQNRRLTDARAVAVPDRGSGQADGAPPPSHLPATQGHGPEPSLPSAASKGQQTAAAHKNAPQGKSAPTHPAHPSHPAKPTKPSKPAQAASPAKAPATAKGSEKAASTPSATGEAPGGSDRDTIPPGHEVAP